MEIYEDKGCSRDRDSSIAQDDGSGNNYGLYMMMLWALFGFCRAVMDVCGKMRAYRARRCGLTQTSPRVEPTMIEGERTAVATATPAFSERSSTVRFVTVSRHAPIWHSVSGTHYHSKLECRGLRGAAGVKKKQECSICGDGGLVSYQPSSSTTTRRED